MAITILLGTLSVLLAIVLQLDKVAPIAAPLLWGNVSGRYVVEHDVAKLGVADTIVIFFCLLRRYAMSALGILRRMAFDAEAAEFILPEITISSTLQLDEALIGRYRKAIGSDDASLEAQLLIWPAVTTPLMLLVMAHPRCPIMPLGAVNVSNAFRWLDVGVCASPAGRKLRVEVTFGGALEGRRVKRGIDFDIQVTCRPADSDEVVFGQTITLLQFLKSSQYRTSHERPPAGAAEAISLDSAKSSSSEMKIAMGAPSLWADVCRDYNPIHMSALAARAFGFASKIGHGNHVLALALVRTGRRIPAGAETTEKKEKKFEMHVAFRRPCLLPAQVEVQADDHALVVARMGKTLVEATFA